MSLEHSPSRSHAKTGVRRFVPEPDLSFPSWDVYVVGKYFGGSKPLHPATVYRGVKKGRIPPPYHPSPGVSRWVPDECRVAREAMIAERDQHRALCKSET